MQSLDERIFFVWLATAMVIATVVGLVVGVADRLFAGIGVWVGPTTFVGLAFAGSLHSVARYRAFRFAYDPDALYLERGVLVRIETIVPTATVRRVDVRRGPLDRLLGLERLVVHTDAHGGSTVTIPGVAAGETARIQRTLLENANGQSGPKPNRTRIQ